MECRLEFLLAMYLGGQLPVVRWWGVDLWLNVADKP